MRQVPLSPLSFDPQRVANVPEYPPPSTRLRSCAHIANRRLSRIIGARGVVKTAVVPQWLRHGGDDACAVERAADALHCRWIDAEPLGNDPYARPPRSRQRRSL